MTYRQIDTSGFVGSKLVEQAVPQLQWVAVADLIIDDRYQREIDSRGRSAVQRIADEFDWMQFSAVLVAPVSGGQYAIIDGQHRVHGAALCGIEKVPALVVLASTAQQAKAFVGVNSKAKPINRHQIYRAALEAGEPWAVQARDAVEAAGCLLATSNPSFALRKPGVIYGTMRIAKLVAEGHGATVTAALLGLRAYDRIGRVALYTDYVVNPLATGLVLSKKKIDVAAFLASNEPYKLLDTAMKLRQRGEKITDAEAMRLAILRFAAGDQ